MDHKSSRSELPFGRAKTSPESAQDGWNVDELAVSLASFMTDDCHLSAAQIRKVALRLLCVCEPKKPGPNQAKS